MRITARNTTKLTTLSTILFVANLAFTLPAYAHHDGASQAGCPPGSARAVVDYGGHTVETCYSPPTTVYIPTYTPPTVGEGGGGPTQLAPPASTTDPDEALGAGDSEGINGDGTCASEGNPVNILSRNKYQREVDFIGPGNFPLSIVRSYNSYGAKRSDFKGLFGQGWTTEFGERIVAVTEPDPNDSPPVHTVLIETDSGYRFKLKSTGGGDWTTTSGRTLVFSYDSQGEHYTWVDGGLTKVFSEAGQLLSVTNELGESLTYYYVANSNPVKLDRIEHSFGGRLSFTYDSQDRISIITGASGEQYKYFYDSDGNLDYVERPAVSGFNKVEYSYLDDPQVPNDNLLETIAYPQDKGVFAKFDYNGIGQATSTEHMQSLYTGGVEKVEFAQVASNPNLKIRTTNVHGKPTEYTYTEVAGLKRLTAVDGLAHGTCAASNSTYTYDSYGFRDKVTDEEGNVTDYDHNQEGHLTSVTTGFGTSEARTMTMTTHSVWGKPTSISTPLLDNTIELDVSTGRVEKITQTNKASYGVANQQRVTDITYETYPNSLTVEKIIVDGPRTDVDDLTTMHYDVSGRLTSVVRNVSSSLSLTTTYSNFDTYGRPRKVTTPTGLTRDLVYDPVGRIVSSTMTADGQPRQTQFEYSHAGDLTKVVFSDGSLTSIGYDQARRLVGIGRDDNDADPDDIFWRTLVHDTASNVTEEQVWEKSLAWVPDPNCNPFFPPFPECGGSFQVSNVLKYDMGYQYDSLNRLIKQTWDYPGRDQEFEYRKDNLLLSTKDGYDRLTTIDYDANLQVEDATYRDGGVSEITYDANGRISDLRDALGQWTYYHRDGFGNAWQVVSPATGTTNYEFDLAGNLDTKTDARGKVLNHEYDALGRLLNTKIGASSTPIHTYEYDTNRPGYLYRVTDESGTHTFTRNQEGKVLSRTDLLSGATLTTSYLYDTHGRNTRITYPSGLQVNYQYDSFGRVSDITAQGSGLALSNVATQIKHYPFGSVRWFVFGNGEVRSVNLNKDYELTYLTSGNNIYNRLYQRDLNGNISSITGRSYTYDNMDRLKTHTGPDGSYQYFYDLNGNRTAQTNNGSLTTFKFDSTGTELYQVTGALSENRYYDANGNTIQIDNRYFDHNDLNRLWRYREGSVTVTYTHNAFGERQLKQQGSTITRYVYDGPSLLHEQIGSVRRDYIYLGGEAVGIVKNGVLYYIHNDHLGRPEYVTNAAKSIVWSGQNNAFGNTPGTDLIGNLNIGFPGQYYDIESGTHYNYFRTYDGSTGRYLQSDPIGLDGGLNTFDYAVQNPLRYTDRFGLEPDFFDFLTCTFGNCGEQYTEKMVGRTVEGIKEVVGDTANEAANTASECLQCIGEEVIGMTPTDVVGNAAEQAGVRGGLQAAETAGDVAGEVIQDVAQRTQGTPAHKVVIKKLGPRLVPYAGQVIWTLDGIKVASCMEGKRRSRD